MSEEPDQESSMEQTNRSSETKPMGRQNIREDLLAQHEPTRERRMQYERETEAMLNQLELGFRREKLGTGLLWGFVVLFMTSALMIAGYRDQLAPEVQLLAMAFGLFIGGSVEVIKHFINRSRIEVLKELKSLELQVFDLKSQLSDRSQTK